VRFLSLRRARPHFQPVSKLTKGARVVHAPNAVPQRGPIFILEGLRDPPTAILPGLFVRPLRTATGPLPRR
jgi:hypothetical protein